MRSPLDGFLNLIEIPESQWDVFRISLEICRIADPGLDPTIHFQKVATLESQLRAHWSASDDLYSTLEAINQTLFTRNGFRGNSEDYYAPENSFLTHVLEFRMGIPVTLSILYHEVASRIGLRLAFVSMPGHFLLKCKTPARDLFIDAFNQGQLLLAEECIELMKRVTQSQSVESATDNLASVPPRSVILRLLTNLKVIYRQKGESQALLQVLDRRIPLLLDPLPDILERGLLKISLEDYRGALLDIEEFVSRTPNKEMKRVVEKQLARVRELAKRSVN